MVRVEKVGFGSSRVFRKKNRVPVGYYPIFRVLPDFRVLPENTHKIRVLPKNTRRIRVLPEKIRVIPEEIRVFSQIISSLIRRKRLAFLYSMIKIHRKHERTPI